MVSFLCKGKLGKMPEKSKKEKRIYKFLTKQ